MHKQQLIALLAILLAGSVIRLTGQQPVEKTNPMKVYMHYMPWFETPETIGKWGWHWTMNTMDPNTIGPDGQREIASHYYPLIGPYASRDRDVIEYHLLLMKLSGIDGILIDWYGTVGSNGDVKELLKSSDSIVSYTDDFGLQFGVVLEDRFSRSIDDVKANMAYLRNNYFNRAEYIRYGEDHDPLVCIFGPVTFEDPADWTSILPAAGEEIEFLPLWYESDEVGANADGEQSWVYQDEQNHITHLTNFYVNRAPALKTAMGSAYPGFKDYYVEGGAGSTYFTIPHYYGSTLAETLDKAAEYRDNIEMLQLVTFNDFGEGTMFEPTVESGFDYLERVQEFTGVAYGVAELKLVHRLFVLRKAYKNDPETQHQLDQVSLHLRNLEMEEAHTLLESIRPTSISPPGDPGRGGSTGTIGHGILLFPNPLVDGTLHISHLPAQGFTRLMITDIKGRVLYSEPLRAGEELYSIRGLTLSPGLFILTLLGAQGATTLKFSVEDTLSY